jgi:hypothetical protein
LTIEESWPYFHKIVTVGIGLNKQNEPEHAKNVLEMSLSSAGCEDIDCLRIVDNKKITEIVADVKNSIPWNPIKLTLYEAYHPVVDGKYLKDQLMNSIRLGKFKKNTPISFNYAQHDAWYFAEKSFGELKKVPAIAALTDDIDRAQVFICCILSFRGMFNFT